MKNTLFYLSSCSTCTRIIKETRPDKSIIRQDIKTQPVTASQLRELVELSGRYEALFSRKAIKYRTLGLKDKNLTEGDFRKLILSDYTFLKRPVFVIDNEIFIGYTKEVIAAVKSRLRK